MPLILSTAVKTRSGIQYDDRTGESYEFPPMYRNVVRAGEAIVYYRSGSRHYFGSGLVGDVAPSSSNRGRLVCQILDYVEFDHLVPIKDATGEYYEDVQTRPIFRQGVRPIDAARFDRIVATGMNHSLEGTEASVERDRVGVKVRNARSGYASAGVLAAVDEYAMVTAIADARRRYPNLDVVRMPHNNPGFDIRIGLAEAPSWFVEVKGTQASECVFFLSEGERRFSVEHHDCFALIVVYGIDYGIGTHVGLAWRQGALDGSDLSLHPRQWHCHLSVEGVTDASS